MTTLAEIQNLAARLDALHTSVLADCPNDARGIVLQAMGLCTDLLVTLCAAMSELDALRGVAHGQARAPSANDE